MLEGNTFSKKWKGKSKGDPKFTHFNPPGEHITNTGMNYLHVYLPIE